MAEPLDEAAVARKPRVGDDDMIDGRFLVPARARRITTDIEFSFDKSV